MEIGDGAGVIRSLRVILRKKNQKEKRHEHYFYEAVAGSWRSFRTSDKKMEP